jgi:hypothetical protein
MALAATFVLAACQTKGPAPGQGAASAPEEVIMAEPEQRAAPDNPHARGLPMNPHAQGMPFEAHQSGDQANPHGPGGKMETPPSHVSGVVELMDVGALKFRAPEAWKFEHPSSSIRRAQFRVSGNTGDAGLVVYFFGNQGAGTPQSNIDRWVGQFKNADGSPLRGTKPIEHEIAGFKVTQIEVAGMYAGGMGAGSPQPQAQTGQRMIATIVNTASGPYYFKFLGPDKTVTENRGALDRLLASMKASE